MPDSAKSQARSLTRRIASWLLGTAGVLAILLAVALGIFRLLVGQIPEYQAEIKARVAEELGLVIDFASLDARLRLAGPELSLREVSIGDGSRGDFLEADEAALTLDAWALIVSRQVAISRLTLGGVQLTVERDAGGTFRLGELAVQPGSGELAELSELIPQSVEVHIRNSVLRYFDRVRDRAWEFDDFEIGIVSIDGRVTAEASVRPPASLARRVELDASAAVSDGSLRGWQVGAEADDIDIAGLKELLPFDLDLELSGGGRVELGAQGEQWRLAAIRLSAELERVQVGAAAADNPPFERLAASGDLSFAAAGTWQLGLESIEVSRAGRDWDDAASSFALERGVDGVAAVALAAEFFRLDDLEPFVRAFPATQLAEQWALFEPSGDIRDLKFALRRRADRLDYELSAAFGELAVRRVGSMPGVAGITGSIEASEDNGRLDFASGAVELDWPALYTAPKAIESLTGQVAWFQSRDVVRVLGVNLGLGILGRVASGGFELQLPSDGSSPTLELKAELDSVELIPAKTYLPAPIMPAEVASWLDRAVVGGRARDIELDFSGPMRSFPFDAGGGEFRIAADIEDATLAYMPDWPRAEQLAGRIEFLNAGFAARGAGRTLSNRATSVAIAIPDMRAGVLNLTAATQGPLTGVIEYLRTAPLIAAHLGPDFERLEARGGDGAVAARLDLPLLDLAAFELDATLEVIDGSFAIAGLGPEISEVNGAIHAREDAVEADGLSAVFLGGPATATLRPSELDGYRAELTVEGETAAESVAASFALPHENLLAGQALWRGRLLMPALDPLATTSTRIVIESNLSGVALRFPEPLAKAPGESVNLRLDLEFAAGNRLELNGNLGATRRFAFGFQSGERGLEFWRGSVRFGGEEPSLPIDSGILVSGRIETLPLDDWLDLAGSSGLGRAGPSFLGAEIEVGDLSAFGQRLGETALRVQRADSAWRINVDSAAIAGDLSVPRGSASREPIIANMQRFYLAAAEDGDFAARDPRELPGLELQAQEFGLGARRFGKVSAVVEADRRGLVLSSFTSSTESYSAALSGSWFQGPLRMRTSIDASLSSIDVEAALTELGIDPVISGESAEVSAQVFFDAPPGGDWLDHLNGDVAIRVETGTLREIDPGAGRMLGLMSIAALPRRLALDFRDVFEEGFAFDEIGGSFRLIDGNAYTNDLKFTGPAAEIGVVGRTGLRDRDYRQQVVVSPEPSNMLPTVAGLLAGPGAGAAFFVFTRLFKEPLKNIGQAAYCLEGSWEAPTVERIGNDEQDRARQCADIPDEMRSDVFDE